MAISMVREFPKEFLWGFSVNEFGLPDGEPDVRDVEVGTASQGHSVSALAQDMSEVTKVTALYDQWKEDVERLANNGVKAYQISLSWSRIIPLGGRNDPVDRNTIRHYSTFIDMLVLNGICPFVTLYSWDLPQALHDRYNGWLNKKEIIADFIRYARVCFEEFGDRVKHWMTIDDPWRIAHLGYGRGLFSARQSDDLDDRPQAKECWFVAHVLVLAHAHAFRLYHDTFKTTQQGDIGITLNGDWAILSDNNEESRDVEFGIDWFADLIYLGSYPFNVRQALGCDLPVYTSDEWAIVKGSSDFFGLNTHTVDIASLATGRDDDMQVDEYHYYGSRLRQQYPDGIRALLTYAWKRYRLPIFITGNGLSADDSTLPHLHNTYDGDEQIEYFQCMIEALLSSIHEDGVIVKSYLPWTFLKRHVRLFGTANMPYDAHKQCHKDAAQWLIRYFNGDFKKSYQKFLAERGNTTPDTSNFYDAGRIINEYLLSVMPHATMAISTDHDWISVLEKDEPSFPSPDVLLERIKAVYEVYMDSGAVGLRKRRTT